MKMKLESILLIDDDKITNYLHEKLIRNTGVTKKVRVAYNGREGLEFISACQDTAELPELILLDLNMPVLNGFEFLEQFQKLGNVIKQKIPIVVLSTSIHPMDKKKLSDINLELVNKPLTEEKLFSICKKHLKTKVKRKFMSKVK